jgi:glycosyltransferase involved in cell wall biosynthesis
LNVRFARPGNAAGRERDFPVRIVARTNGFGIDRDVRILTDALSAFREAPTLSRYRSIAPFRRFYGRRNERESIVFLERVTARWLRHAGRYVLIPNQERYARRLIPLLRHVDHVFCKSDHAREIFAALHGSVHLLGFTSIDRRLPAAAPDYGRFLHVAGASFLKGTSLLLDLWRRHPDWPVLTVVRRRADGARDVVPRNVEIIEGYLPDDDLRELQNRCGVHLCPSRSEGWGHYIVEAMSCGAVTVVTDAPPMNELIGADRGVAVPYHDSEPRKLGTNYYVDPVRLEAAIAELIERSNSEKAALGGTARQWFEANDRTFRTNLRRLWDEHCSDGSARRSWR